MTSLADALNGLLWAAKDVFPQHRTFLRARLLAFGFIITWGRHTVSQAICALQHQFQDWSADYRLFSRSPWEPNDLFQPVLEKSVAMSNGTGPIPIAMDDTTARKTSKDIPGVGYARDPMSPKFHPNLILGQRFIQAATIIRPEGLAGPARTIPIRFQPAPPPTKPAKTAGEAEWQAYREAKRTRNLSCQAVEIMNDIRQRLDDAGYVHRIALFVVDGGYCNRTVFRGLPDRVEILARARGDISLCRPPTAEQVAGKGRRRKYGDSLPTPEEIRKSDAYEWCEAAIWGAGRVHQLKFKLVTDVLWRRGALARPLRLIIIAPLGYRPTPKSRKLYRKPAYLLTTDLTTSVETLIQAYFDRWEIEVNHRDEKSLFGVGEAQVRSSQAAPRLPQFLVAVYAMLLLSALQAHGPKRTEQYGPRPAWYKREGGRPSIADILGLLREELIVTGISTVPTTKCQSGGRHASRLKGVRIAG